MICEYDDATQCKHAPLSDGFDCRDCKYYRKLFNPKEAFYKRNFLPIMIVLFLLIMIAGLWTWTTF